LIASRAAAHNLGGGFVSQFAKATLMFRNILKSAVLACALAAVTIGSAYALNVDQKRNIPARTQPGQVVQYCRVTVNYNDPNIKTGQSFCTLSKSAYILSIDAQVTTAFNAATTNVFTIGATSASSNEIVADGGSGSTTNISNSTTSIAAGMFHLTAAAGIGLTVTSNATYQTALNGGVPIFAKYTQTGTAATTGAITVIIAYCENNDN
jgi:hypothetical protein